MRTTFAAPTRRFSPRTDRKLNIRRATPADIPEMMRIEQSSGNAAHWSEQRYRDLFNESAPRRLALVMEEQGIAAFLVASIANADCEIENVVVLEDRRRLGLGRNLLIELLDQARREQATSIFLEVRESNLAARKLYENFGFHQTAVRPRYYSHPEEDAILYRFEIK